jgi:hypothetical protein
MKNICTSKFFSFIACVVDTVNSLSLVLLAPVINLLFGNISENFLKTSNALMEYFGARWTLIHEKIGNRKSRVRLSLRRTKLNIFDEMSFQAQKRMKSEQENCKLFSLDKLFVSKHVICNNLTSADTVKWNS